MFFPSQDLLKHTTVSSVNAYDANLGIDDIRKYVERLGIFEHPQFDITNPNGTLIFGSAHENHEDDNDYPDEVNHAYIDFRPHFKSRNSYLINSYLIRYYIMTDLSIPKDVPEYINYTGQWTTARRQHCHLKSIAAEVAVQFFGTGLLPQGLIWLCLRYYGDRHPLTAALALGQDDGGEYKRQQNPDLEMIVEALERLDGARFNRVYIRTNQYHIFLHSALSSGRVAVIFYDRFIEGIVQQSLMIDETQYGKDIEVEIALSKYKRMSLKFYETVPKDVALAAICEYFEKVSRSARHWRIYWHIKSSEGNL